MNFFSLDVADLSSEESTDGEPGPEVCLLCDKNMTESSVITTVKNKGIESLIHASKRRRDGKVDKLKRFNQIKVHNACKTAYTKDYNIQVVEKNRSIKISQDRKRQKIGREFDFSSNCFFCGNALYARDEYKQIKNQATVNNILRQLTNYETNEKNKNIKSRVCTLGDQNDEFYTSNRVYYHAIVYYIPG